MKKKSASQSAFFKLRLLIGVLLCFAAVSIVLLAQPELPPAIGQFAATTVRAQYRGVMPVVKFDISPPLRSMKPLPVKECTLRENEERGADSARTRRSGCARYGCAAGARQNWNTGSDHQLRWKQQSVRLRSAGPERSGRSQSCGDDGQSAFSDLQQDRDIAVRSGSEQYALVWIWRGLPDPKRRRSSRALRPAG